MKHLTCLLLALTPALLAQTYDFEDGLAGWTRDRIFDAQPVRGDSIRSGRLGGITLGGDYWRDLPYPLGQHGAFLIATAENNLGDTATGALISPEFTIDRSKLCLSLLVGGSNDPAHELIELQVADGNQFRTVFSATGRTEALRQEVFTIPDSLAGRKARIRILDASTEGHINVDNIQFTAAAPDPPHTPVWGYADYHTHPMTYLAFGALQPNPHQPIWGYPGGNFDDYFNPAMIACDLPHCPLGHNGGLASELFLDMAQSVAAKLWSKWTLRSILPHQHAGGPEFTDFPSFYMGAHQQMHITQIHRNYEGGLRILVGLVTDNLGAEYLTSRAIHSHVETVPAQHSLEAQICGMLLMAELNHQWMEIAYTAEQARDIILRNKLAVIMGVELDQLMQIDPGQLKTPAQEVEYLWKLGVRAVTPIHAVNNEIGGPAIFEDPYNWDNDLVHRGENRDYTSGDLQTHPATFFEVEEDPTANQRGQSVLFKLNVDQARVALVRSPFLLFRRTPFIDAVKWPAYNTTGGQKNKLGIKPRGIEYLRALMDKGMIVDTAHMSDRSVADVYSLVADRFKSCTGPNCAKYPIIVSHAHFRAQAYYNADAPADLQPSEYDISNQNLEQIKEVGGVIGPFTSQAAIDSDDVDCTMSTKSFATAYHYAVEHLGGRGVGMATDFTFIPGVSPRFGPNACAGYKARPSLKYELRGARRHYQPRQQRDAIVYQRIAQPGLPLGHNIPITAYTMGARTFDYNVDGLAHFGMIPDMLQDLRNVDPHHAQDLTALFNSAESYIEMWETAERLSGCNASNSFCNPEPPKPACRLPGAPPCR